SSLLLDEVGVFIVLCALSKAGVRQGSRFDFTDLLKCYLLTDPTVRPRFAALVDKRLNGEQACKQTLEYGSVRKRRPAAVSFHVLELQ
ncbi:AraC family transcriptional regulator, partial [Pseudomonas syringae pv. tagetis]